MYVSKTPLKYFYITHMLDEPRVRDVGRDVGRICVETARDAMIIQNAGRLAWRMRGCDAPTSGLDCKAYFPGPCGKTSRGRPSDEAAPVPSPTCDRNERVCDRVRPYVFGHASGAADAPTATASATNVRRRSMRV